MPPADYYRGREADLPAFLLACSFKYVWRGLWWQRRPHFKKIYLNFFTGFSQAAVCNDILPPPKHLLPQMIPVAYQYVFCSK